MVDKLDYTLSKHAKAVLWGTIAVKLLLVVLFSSGYKDQLFIPFVLHFLDIGGNPWESASIYGLEPVEFPYPPFMLYILSVFLWPSTWFGDVEWVQHFFYGLPLLFSDFLIFYSLACLFRWQKTEIYIFYFLSPIIIYACYMHGQLDIIPTSFFFFGLTLLSKRHFLGAFIFMGLAFSTKLHTLAAAPLIALYLMNQKQYIPLLQFIGISAAMTLFFVFPYVGSEAYQSLVLNNQKQKIIFDTFIELKDVKVYLPILVSMLLYLRFASFPKVNRDLLFASVGTLFSAILLLVEASPGWFVWVVPFFTVFYIRYYDGIHYYFYYTVLIVAYLIYYILFFRYEYTPLLFLGQPVSISYFDSENVRSLFFTILEAALLFTIYCFYRSGIASNKIYTMNQSFVLGIGGDSGAGKTTLLDGLHRLLGSELLQLEGDGDHKWERGNEKWQHITHLNPKANLIHNQANNIADLKFRRVIKRSDYLHDTGKFSEKEQVKPKNFIVIAGLHTLYLPIMRKVIDLKIFLDVDESLRIHWKLERDVKQRGHTVEKVMQSLEKRAGDSKKYIHPQRQFADIIIRFYPLNEIVLGETEDVEMGLKLTLDASIHLEALVRHLKENNIDVTWDYSDDLQSQVLDFRSEPLEINYALIASHMIANAAELTESPRWDKGYCGLVQFVLLMVMSEILKEKALHHE